MKKLTLIDLFCGCGGFSLGMERAGFSCFAAVDFNAGAMAVFEKNSACVPQVLAKDLTWFPPAQLAKLLRTENVDVIVGRPPCQGFSTVRQVDSPNSVTPVVLAPVANEAWRRYVSGSVKDDEFYCAEAQMAGICHRSPEVAEEIRDDRKWVAS